MAPSGHPPVVARHRHPALGELDPVGPGPFEQLDPPPEQCLFEGGGHLGVLVGQNLLPADDQRHGGAERAEHVDELDASDPRPDDHQVVRHPRRGVGLPGGQYPLSVRKGPVGNPRAASRRHDDGVGVDLLDTRLGVGHDQVGTLEPAGTPDKADPLALEQPAHLVIEVVLDLLHPAPLRVDVQGGVLVRKPHALDPPGKAHGPTRGDHGLGGDAVPQVGGAPDDVSFDQGDVGPQAGGVGSRRVATRPAPDDDQPHPYITGSAGKHRTRNAARRSLLRAWPAIAKRV